MRSPHWQHTFRYILVDEYQDTNHAQYPLLQLLAGERGERVRRRGMQDRWRIRLPRRHRALARHPSNSSVTSPGPTRSPLEQNYRSTNAILGCGERRDREQPGPRNPKRLFSKSSEERRYPSRQIEVEDEHSEAAIRRRGDRAACRRGLVGGRDRRLLVPDKRPA